MTRVYMAAIQARLKQARLAAGFDSISAGARAAGVPVPSALSHENTTTPSGRKPKLDALVKYSDAYGVSLDWLVTGRRSRQ